MAAWTKIYNAEPVVADSKASGHVNEPSNIVWPAMSHRSHHPIKRRLIEPSLRIYQPAAYRAHSVSPFAERLLKPLRSLVKLYQWSAEELAILCADANKLLIFHILRAPSRLDQFGHHRVQRKCSP
jgi:hypothetical protein